MRHHRGASSCFTVGVPADERRAVGDHRRQLLDLELLVDGGFFDYDVASRTVEWSVGLRRLYGVTDPTFNAGLDGWLAMVHEDDRDVARAAITDAATTISAFDFEHRFVRGDGVERWAHCRGTVDGDADGRPLRLFGVSVDVTEQRRNASLLSEFIANAAHELRTPAAAIGQAVHALQVATSEEDRRTVLEILARQASRLRSLTVNLVDLGRLEADDTAPERRPVSVAAALADALALAPVPLDRHFDDRGVDADACVWAEPNLLERVLVNLLVNAWRYGGPTVTVATRLAGERVEIVVCDDGDGVPESVRDALFEPFRRGPQRHPEASGLGLAIVAGLLRSLGGSIEHRVGGPGATFVVTLDRAPPPQLVP